MMKLIMFGIGCSAEEIECKLRKEHEIIGYTDSRARIRFYKGIPFYSLPELKNVKFDYIVITTSNRIAALELREMLVHLYGIVLEKIIPFCLYCDTEVYKIKMQRYGGGVKCAILGNSHARDGILANFLSVPSINLATSSQDIYFNCRAFEICAEQYRKQLSELQYVIFDLYDYNAFNIDVSVTDDFFNYLDSGGVLEPHNFLHSNVYKNGFEKDVFDRLCLITEKSSWMKEIMETLFCDSSGKLDAAIEESDRRTKSIHKMEPLATEKCFSGIVTKRYGDTIRENRRVLENFCQSVKKLNSNINIIFTLLPRYITMEKIMEPFMKEWKDEFECIINEFCFKYGAKYLNYKGREDISGNNYFYWDINHLNTAGGISLTSIIDADLKRIL